jgi:hypothetical protein
MECQSQGVGRLDRGAAHKGPWIVLAAAITVSMVAHRCDGLPCPGGVCEGDLRVRSLAGRAGKTPCAAGWLCGCLLAITLLRAASLTPR